MTSNGSLALRICETWIANIGASAWSEPVGRPYLIPSSPHVETAPLMRFGTGSDV